VGSNPSSSSSEPKGDLYYRARALALALAVSREPELAPGDDDYSSPYEPQLFSFPSVGWGTTCVAGVVLAVPFSVLPTTGFSPS
jgi:hypothetical protein